MPRCIPPPRQFVMCCCLGIRKRQPKPVISGTHGPISGLPSPQVNHEAPGTQDRPKGVPSPDSTTHTEEKEEIVITGIRATNLALGLRRIPAGFHVVVHYSDLEFKTENIPVSVNHDVVDWRGPIPIPSDLPAIVSLAIYASFEFRPVLGHGEQLRKITITVNELLNRSEKDIPFTFFPKDGDIVSPCSSLSVTVERQKCENNSVSRILQPHSSALGSGAELENATNQGHSALSRYRKYRGVGDLEHATEWFQRALDLCPLSHPCRAVAESNMATAKFIHYRVHVNASLDIPVMLYHNALAARSVGHPDRPSTLIQLAAVHLAKLEKWWDEVDRAQVAALLEEAVTLSSSESHEQQAAIFMMRLHVERTTGATRARRQSPMEQYPASPSTDVVDPWALSVQLLHCFQKHGNLADLQLAISVLERSIRSIPQWDRRYLEGLANLGLALSYRFDHCGDLADLEEAILKQQHTVDLTPNGHPDKPAYLNNLGTSFQSRFERLGEIQDLEEAISRVQDAVDLIPDGHPNKPGYLNNLGTLILTRFKRLGEIKDVEEAISGQRNVDLIPDGHPDKPVCLSNLGNSFLIRFNRLGDIKDLEEGISRQQDAVNLTPNGHIDKPSRLSNLGNSLLTRFEHLGEFRDLDEAISRQQNAVDLTHNGHPDKPACLSNLSNSFLTRFEHLGNIRDLEDAILRQQDAVDLTPNGHPDKPGYLNSLGSSFLARFERLGEIKDLEEAILRQQNVDLIPNSHADKPARLNNLGNSFLTRFERLGEIWDLEAGISRQQDAVDLIPNGHVDKPACLNNLGNSLLTRFRCLGEIRDLDEAISRQQDAVNLTPNGHPAKPGRLNNLGNSFKIRFERLEEIKDLEEAISKQQRAVDCTPNGHSDKPGYLSNLGNSFLTRFQRLNRVKDLEEAILLFSQAACAPVGPVTIRLRASQQWIRCARLLPHESLLPAYSVTIDLLPQLAWIGLSLAHRYRELVRVADVARDAAAAALDSGHTETAVEWLEHGRSVVWGELLQLRSSYDELTSAHPDHAHRLRELSAALERAGSAREKSLSEQSNRAIKSLQCEADQHRKIAIERDQLVQDIRKLPGFERFLLRKEFSELRASAHSGPVVILNAAETRCDALIVLATVDHVIHVPLPNFTLDRSKQLETSLKEFVRDTRDDRYGYAVEEEDARATQWKAILSSLWKCVVKPVLDALAFSTPGDLSRIFWCPTGPFTFLPIHAAGFYDDARNSEPGHKVFDFLISSYIPTLSILAASPNFNLVSQSDLRLLTVPQPPSDGQNPLPGVVTELEHIKTVIKNSPSARITLTEPSVGTVEEALALMREADWVHFACHGIQDDGNPTNSGLCLANERRLRVADMVTLSRPHGGLAFLSACQTAKGDGALSDEAIHIAAGMLFAGYGGVIGTMWSINDKIAPDVARDVYEQLFRRNGAAIPDYREAARALHIAVGRLRESNASFEHWLPFIHVGL